MGRFRYTVYGDASSFCYKQKGFFVIPTEDRAAGMTKAPLNKRQTLPYTENCKPKPDNRP